MEIILHSLQSIVSIVVMMVLGIVLAKRGWFSDESTKLIADLVTKISLPCLVLLNITNNFKHGDFDKLVNDMTLPVLSVVISYIIGTVCCHLLRVPKGRRSIFKAMFYVANCVYIGLPINVALFGESSTVYVFEYFMANTTALWCVAVYEIAVDGSAEKVKFDFFATIKKIIFSPIIGFFAAIVLITLNIQLHDTAKDTLKYIGSLTTPLSMIFIGIELSKTKPSELKMNFEMFVGHLGKFAVGPLLMFLMHNFVTVSDLHFKVMVIQASTPVAVALPLLAATYGVDTKYAAIITSTSTILFLFVLPLYMWILHIYFGN